MGDLVVDELDFVGEFCVGGFGEISVCEEGGDIGL